MSECAGLFETAIKASSPAITTSVIYRGRESTDLTVCFHEARPKDTVVRNLHVYIFSSVDLLNGG